MSEFQAHAVDQRSDWQAAEAVESSVTLNFSNEKSPLRCDLSSKFFDYLFFVRTLVIDKSTVISGIVVAVCRTGATIS